MKNSACAVGLAVVVLALGPVAFGVQFGTPVVQPALVP